MHAVLEEAREAAGNHFRDEQLTGAARQCVPIDVSNLPIVLGNSRRKLT
jgi:hypothetical protein